MPRLILVASLAVLLAGLHGATARAAGLCNRDCLAGVADKYLEALRSHDPARLRLAGSVKFSENGVRLAIGDALWTTVSAVGTHEVSFADPFGGEVGLFAVVEEGGRPALLAARLKVTGTLVSEIETTVARKETASFMDPAGWVAEKPSLYEDVPAAERHPRRELTRIADSYFDAVADAAKPLPPFDPACNRIENGVQTTNKPAAGQGALNDAVASLGCAEQFKRQALKFVSRVRDRRYVAIDEQKGLVLCEALFDHDGVSRKDPTAPVLAAPLPSPYSFVVAELFKIRDGRIYEIQAVISQVPYGMKPVW